jgi:hypothetical protein
MDAVNRFKLVCITALIILMSRVYHINWHKYAHFLNTILERYRGTRPLNNIASSSTFNISFFSQRQQEYGNGLLKWPCICWLWLCLLVLYCFWARLFSCKLWLVADATMIMLSLPRVPLAPPISPTPPPAPYNNPKRCNAEMTSICFSFVVKSLFKT